jgi:Xaa-Pro aminopeptidase
VAALETLRRHLESLQPHGDGFRDGAGTAVTLGHLRQHLQRAFLEHGLSEEADSIVSQGRDAGVPHNRGNDGEPLRAATPLLVDIFPGETGGGYHSDVTRTYCLGSAPDPQRRLYDDVHDAHQLARTRLAVGAPCRDLQEAVCDLFEQRGHATRRTDQAAHEGYVHSLGHGVGLSVHEDPLLGGPPANAEVLTPGMVITLEPGLYYPSRGMGVRIEDLVLVRGDGTFENLTPAPYELEIATPR